jgi:hypothetical protein
MSIKWPNDFDGAHHIGGVDTGTSDPLYGAVPPKIYESPDKGKTIYERDFGSIERTLVKTAIQQQWNITFNGTPVSDEDCRRINL